ncbi:hypothetical protein H9P43_008485 [Blastocladiella emersonii ATCC 22665]|nr:hypothetical protein H9P43_008485 [Blastocladiella emersonii ATCC 22665]
MENSDDTPPSTPHVTASNGALGSPVVGGDPLGAPPTEPATPAVVAPIASRLTNDFLLADLGPSTCGVKRPASPHASPSRSPRKVFRRDGPSVVAPAAAPTTAPTTAASLNLTVERLLQTTNAAALAALAEGDGKGKKKRRDDGKVQATLDFTGGRRPKDEVPDPPPPPPPPARPIAPIPPPTRRGGRTYHMMGVDVRFPFEAYPSQLAMMSKIIEALRAGTNALLESPTGSGKSLALLCATLAWRGSEFSRRGVSAYEPDLPETRKEKGTGTGITVPRLSGIAAAARARARERDRKHVKVELEDDDMDLPKPPGVPRIYFGSRTHRQLAQIVDELRDNSTYVPRMAVLGSRTHYCINKMVRRAPGNINDACSDAIEHKTCTYFKNATALASSHQLPPIWDVEDMRGLGMELKGCPYFAARTLAETAELILCPYNYLLDPQIRDAVGIDLDNAIVVLDEAHNVEDVAREAAGCEIEDLQLWILIKELAKLIKHFKEAPEDEIHLAVGGTGEPQYSDLLRFVQALNRFLIDHVKTFREQTFEHKLNVISPFVFLQHLEGSGVTLDSLVDVQVALERVAECKAEQKRRENDSRTFGDKDFVFVNMPILSDQSFRMIGSLLTSIGNVFDEKFTADFHVVTSERVLRNGEDESDPIVLDDEGEPVSEPDGNSGDPEKRKVRHKLALWCMNPGVTFSALGQQAYSVLLTSGTLSPMATFASELQVDFPIRLEADHVIQLDQTWVGAVNSPELLGTFQQSEMFQYQDAIGWAVVEMARHVPHGMLVFVPSYAFLNKIIDRWRFTGAMAALEHAKKVFTEPRSSKDGAFEDVINGFYEAVDESTRREAAVGHWAGGGALMFGVYRGKVSEGIDFSNNRARAVACVGIPFPSVMDKKIKLKKAYNDHHRSRRGLLSGSEWYDIQAYRAINQALGRCIRHRNGWGALVLLDRRFAMPKHQMGLSKWVRPRITVWNHLGAALENVIGFLEYRGVKYPPPPGAQPALEQAQAQIKMEVVVKEEEEARDESDASESSDDESESGSVTPKLEPQS